jgi:CHAD domain-containing protein
MKPYPSGIIFNAEYDMALDRNRLLKPARKLRKLVNKIDSKPSPDEVHDLRTNTRRFEAIFEVLSLDPHSLSTSVLKKLARCRKRAGKVRDLDVLTAYASKVHLEGEDECETELLEHMGGRRQRLAKKLHAEIRWRGPALRKDLKRSLAELKKALRDDGGVGQTSLASSSSAHNASAVRLNAAAAAVKLGLQLAAPPRLGRQNLHPYRLKIKTLQNVLRMAATPSHPKFLEDLGEVKDAIGEWHDWEELVSLAQQVLDHGKGCGLLAELKNTAHRKYDHALARAEALRKNYLRSVHPQQNGASAASKIPAEPVWEAIAMLAA